MESMDRFCWSCGSGISKGDQFCRKCGSYLGQGQPIEQGHETQPEASTVPEIDPPKAKPTHVAGFSVLRPPPPKKAVVEDVADLLVHCVAHPCLCKSIETMAAVSTVVSIIAGLGVEEPSTRLR